MLWKLHHVKEERRLKQQCEKETSAAEHTSTHSHACVQVTGEMQRGNQEVATPNCCSWWWFAGLVCIGLGNAFDFISLGITKQSVVTLVS